MWSLGREATPDPFFIHPSGIGNQSSHLKPTPTLAPPSCLGLNLGGGGGGGGEWFEINDVWVEPIKIPRLIILHYLGVDKQF